MLWASQSKVFYPCSIKTIQAFWMLTAYFFPTWIVLFYRDSSIPQASQIIINFMLPAFFLMLWASQSKVFNPCSIKTIQALWMLIAYFFSWCILSCYMYISMLLASLSWYISILSARTKICSEQQKFAVSTRR